MFYARLLAGLTFAAFSLAAGGTLRLAIAGSLRRLPSALPVNPLDSSAWIALGLEAEHSGDNARAAACLLQAEKVDHQYLPAWTAANFFFRHSNDVEFWRAARRAAAMSYDDPAPLIDLADHREPRAGAAFERLGGTPRLERAYLYFLIGQSRWPEAQEAAARLAGRQDRQDDELLLNFSDRLLAAGKVEAALQFAHARPGRVTNGEFRTEPSGQAFDWRVMAPPGGAARWELSRLRLWLPNPMPDVCWLLEQKVAFAPGKYRLRVEYRSQGLAEQSGLRWVVAHDGIEEVSGPSLARAAGGARHMEWNFEVRKAGIHLLQLVYRRLPGTLSLPGNIEISSVSLEAL